MRLAKIWIPGAGALALVAAAAFPWPVPGQTLNDEIIRQIARASGLGAIVAGGAKFALLPAPRVELHDVRISDRAGTIRIDAGIVEGKVRLLPLIAGRLEVTALDLRQPFMTFDLHRLTLESLRTIVMTPDTADRMRTGTPADAPRLQTLSIAGGHARLVNSATSMEPVEFSAINLVASWNSLAAPFAIGGKASWRDEMFDFTSLLAHPIALLRGEVSPASVKILSRLGTLGLEGDLAGLPRLQFAGGLNASTPSASDLLAAFKTEIPLPGRVERVSISAQSRIHAQTLALSALRLDVENNQFAGTLGMQSDEGKARITGTLAAAALNFNTRAGYLPRLFDGDGWSSETLNTQSLSKMDMDIRLSTERLNVGRISLADVALSSIVKDGALELALSTTGSYKGSIKARLSLAGNQALPQARALVQFDNIDAGAFIRDASGAPRISGTASGETSMRTSGTSILQLVQNSSGAFRASLSDGAFQGLDLDLALRRAQTQPLSLPSDIRSGRTTFRRANVEGALDAGTLRLTRGFSESDDLNVAVTGAISLTKKSLLLDVDASRLPAAAAGKSEHPTLKFDVAGPWASPTILLDAESLINNSEAAAPLTRNLQRLLKSPVPPAAIKPLP